MFSILQRGESLYKEKGSKHYGIALACNAASEIKKILFSIQQLHAKADHICYAFKLFEKDFIMNANDAGEPSGSAGKPILSQIESANLCNVIVLVARYFGGTKLGVSGLIKAYKTAATMAIDNATLQELIFYKKIELRFPFALQSELDYLLTQYKAHILEKNFEQIVHYKCQIPENVYSDLTLQLDKFYELEFKFLTE